MLLARQFQFIAARLLAAFCHWLPFRLKMYLAWTQLCGNPLHIWSHSERRESLSLHWHAATDLSEISKKSLKNFSLHETPIDHKLCSEVFYSAACYEQNNFAACEGSSICTFKLRCWKPHWTHGGGLDSLNCGAVIRGAGAVTRGVDGDTVASRREALADGCMSLSTQGWESRTSRRDKTTE